MSILRLTASTVSCLLLLGACKESSSLPFSIEVMPQTITREPGERVEATLTVSSRSGEYANDVVQVDVVQLAGSVIDELAEGDVDGMVEGFTAIDPEMSGLGVRWKRMRWTLASDAPSRQRDFSWVCGEGTTAALFFVTVNGEPVSAPTGPTWQAVRSDSSLEPAVADVIERELGLTLDRELELLPIGCGEDPDAGPSDGGVRDAPDADGGGVDAGPGGGERTISGFFTNFYGMSPDGTVWFLAGNPSNELYRVAPGEEDATQRSNAADIGAALGTSVTSYGVSTLSVTEDGAAVVRVVTDSDVCLMIARSTSWTRVLCEGDELADGPVQSFNQSAVYADDTVGYLALMVVQVADVPRLIFLLDTGSMEIVNEVARAMAPMPGLDTTSLVESIDSLVVSSAGRVGYRLQAFDGTVAVYSDDGTGPSVLAWMNVRADPPEGAPVTPPADVNITAYSFGNRAIDGLTINAAGTLAWVVKLIGVDGLRDGSGIWVSAPDVRNAVPLPMIDGETIESGFSALPAFQYALVDDDSIVVNGRFTQVATIGQAIWRVPAMGSPSRLFSTDATAPGSADAVVSMGPMVVSADGAVAFTALLAGDGIDETNDAVIFAVPPGGDVVQMARFGDEIDVAGVPVALDLLDMGNTGVRAPPMILGDEPLAGDFLVTDVRDIHVVYGPGTAGRGASFSAAGCGSPLIRAGSFLASAENVLIANPIPGTCP